MRNLAFVAWAQLALASLSYAATPPKKTTPSPATPAPATAAAKSSAKPVVKPAPKIGTKAPPPRARTYYRYRAPARPVVQQVPTPERYKEIQQALADKGYFKGTVDGQWSADSVDALKHFQADQNLQSDGKLDSLSLIGLGLGPKRMTAQSAPPLDKQ